MGHSEKPASVTNFAALGQRLRDAREAKELSPDDVERATRIRARFVEQMERGDYSGMTPVQAQGFLRNYARFLGLDLDLLESELTGEEPKGRLGRARRDPQPPAAPAARPRTAAPARAEGTPRRRRRGWLTSAGIVAIAGAIVVLFVLGATALLNRASEPAAEENEPTIEGTPEPAGELDPAPEQENDAGEGSLADDGVESTPAEEDAAPLTPALAYTPPGDTNSNVVVSINLTQRTWLRVTVDGEVTRQGLATPGEVWQFEGQESVGLRASNAAALELSVNNQRQGPLGERGQLFDQTFTREGLAAPPTAAPSSTAPAPDTLSSNPAPAAVTASPELATLVLSPTLDPNAPLASGLEGGVLNPLASATAEIPSPAATPTEPPAPPRPTLTPTRRPTITATSTRAPLPTLPPSATPTPPVTPSATASPTPSATPTLTPPPSATRTPTVTPTATLSLTPTVSPSPTPFLPPRMTRTPTASPK